MIQNYLLSNRTYKLIVKGKKATWLYCLCCMLPGLFFAASAEAQVLGWSTYIGGSANADFSKSIKIDHAGNIVLAGYSGSTDFPKLNNGIGYYATNPSASNDLFIMKFDANGAMTWSTLFGTPTSDDQLYDMDVDTANNIFITGRAGNLPSFAGLPLCGPPTNGGFPLCDPGGGAYFDSVYSGPNWDNYIAKFNSDGVLKWSTYLGTGCDEWNNGIALDNSGNVYAAGWSWCTTIAPAMNPGGGAYYTNGTTNGPIIFKFNNSGVLKWATQFLTGNDPNREKILKIKTFGAYVYVVGTTVNAVAGSPLCAPPTNGGFTLCDQGGGAYYQNVKGAGTTEDCFIAKFDTAGVLKWSTYYGGDNTDIPNDLFIDAFGNVFMVGQTSSTNFPVFDPGSGAYFSNTNSGGADGFIVEFNSSGVRQWATYFGGNASDRVLGVTIDPGRNIILTLVIATTTTGIPVCTVPTNGGIPFCNAGAGAYSQSAFGGGTNDTYIAVFNSAYILQNATYYGGSGNDVAAAGAITTNGVGDVFITGFTISSVAGSPLCGVPTNSGLPLCDPGGGAYYDASYNGGSNDIYLAKLNTIVQLPVELLSFQAESRENKYILSTWTTTAETNNDYFIVERSKDLQTWEQVGKVTGFGNTTQKHDYSLPDMNPYQGTSYYRLKQVDFNGDHEYYGPVTVRLNGMEIISIYPTPATDHISYSVVSSSESYVTLIVMDIRGRRVMNKIELIHPGENRFSLPLNGMAEGYYLLRLEEVNGNSRTQKQFVVK